MNLKDFINQYIDGVKNINRETTGRQSFSVAILAEELGIIEDRVRSWTKGSKPSDPNDIIKLTAYFGINNWENIPENLLNHSLNKYKTTLVKESNKKEVIALGKHVPLRLKPEEYSEAFGDWKGLPMYNVPITASFIETYRDERIYQPQYYLHDPRFRDCDFGAVITGDSMHSEIRHGDFVACQEIKDRRFIVYGDIYYVVAINGLETCKYLNADPDDKKIICSFQEMIK